MFYLYKVYVKAIPFGHLRFERSSEWIPAMQVNIILFKEKFLKSFVINFKFSRRWNKLFKMLGSGNNH